MLQGTICVTIHNIVTAERKVLFKNVFVAYVALKANKGTDVQDSLAVTDRCFERRCVLAEYTWSGQSIGFFIFW